MLRRRTMTLSVIPAAARPAPPSTERRAGGSRRGRAAEATACAFRALGSAACHGWWSSPPQSCCGSCCASSEASPRRENHVSPAKQRVRVRALNGEIAAVRRDIVPLSARAAQERGKVAAEVEQPHRVARLGNQPSRSPACTRSIRSSLCRQSRFSRANVAGSPRVRRSHATRASSDSTTSTLTPECTSASAARRARSTVVR